MSEQGQWSIGLRHEELRHNLWDSYQTPYVGANGGNSFTLPGFGLAANTTTLTTDQLAAYHNLNVDSTRRSSAASGAGASGVYLLSPDSGALPGMRLR